MQASPGRIAAVVIAAIAGVGIAVLLLTGSSSGPPQQSPPPDVAFLHRTGLQVVFVEQHDRLPIGRDEAIATGGRGAPAEAWLVVVVEGDGTASAGLPGLRRLSEYVDFRKPLWFVIVDRAPDLGGRTNPGHPAVRSRAANNGDWFNVAFVDPYSGAYVIGLSGQLEPDDSEAPSNARSR
jgi:hypothetical protein